MDRPSSARRHQAEEVAARDPVRPEAHERAPGPGIGGEDGLGTGEAYGEVSRLDGRLGQEAVEHRLIEQHVIGCREEHRMG